MPPVTGLLWLRRDLRRADLPALSVAAAAGEVVVVFVIDPALWDRSGSPRRAWLAATLQATNAAYDDALTLRVGDPGTVIPELAAQVGASAVHVSRETTPRGRRRDEAVAGALRDRGVEWVQTGTPYAVGPGRLGTEQNEPYKVFTPFSRAWTAHGWPGPAAQPQDLRLRTVASDPDAWARVEAALTVDGLPQLPPAGEQAARTRWREFLAEDLAGYARERDRVDLTSTSRLSPYLKLGAIHPRTLLADLGPRDDLAAQRFRAELCWREFYADVLWHHPRSAWEDLRPTLTGMRYDEGADVEARVQAWREGRTGYPIVDAAMRQLLAAGWMHNRTRMITASFLTKDLHVWWSVGARHFMDHLIDGDLASNNHGWQWVAGTGTDAAPYFRVFNPITQGLRFDPDGDYVRRWVPELAHLAGATAHEPWREESGYRHGYPERIVDHARERTEALRRYDEARA